MIDRSIDVLETNLALLPLATQQAIRAAAHPAISLSNSDARLRASIKTDDNRWVPVHASDDPMAASVRVVEKLAQTQPPLILVIGIGLGYLLDALDAAQSPVRVLAIEPLPVTTRAMLARRDCSAWLSSGRLTIVAGPDFVGAGDAWRLFGRNALTPPTMMAPVIEREFPGEAARAKQLVKQIVAGARANEEARRQFAGRYLLNTLTNIPTIAAEGDAASLFGAFSRVPAVVVAAGPSLDRNIRDLTRLEGRVLIIAVDTAVRPLLAAGIHPHVVVSVDPSELNARHLKELPVTRGSWLVAEGSIDPAVFPQFRGRTFTFKVSQHHPWPWLEANGVGRGTLRAWGSVLTTAVDFACRAGCDPIIFAGADLAYSRGLQYCRNTIYEDRWRHLQTDAERAEQFKNYLAQTAHLTQLDVHGGEVITTPHFIQFRDWIVGRANEAADRRIVNATGGGILHGGRIAQTDFSVLHLPKAKGDLDLHPRLHSAWMAGSDTRRSSHRHLAAALDDNSAQPTDAWLEFGGDTADAPQIGSAVDTARAGVVRHARTASYLSQCALDADSHAATLDQAKRWIHPNHDAATVQAESQQAHVLLEYMQRSHTSPEVGSTRAVVMAGTERLASLRILDVGCGVGRTIGPFVTAGHRVDGVDISQRLIDLARQHPTLASCRFFLSDGDDCGAAPDGTYDLATLHLMLHLIKSRSVRTSLLRAVARALRPGGMFFVQMPFDAFRTAAQIRAPHVAWHQDLLDAGPAQFTGQVWPTTDALPDMLRDFSEAFRDVRFQFINFPARPDGQPPLTHLLVSGVTSGTLAERIYSLPTVVVDRQTPILPFPSVSGIR